ncbi:hypothetical protein CNMCM6936_009420 [Aspergillus lentulus]|nr:hypothetical protein CNMCM6069_003671 [Aspergillus lentulus]KAF4164274.1 hypothetical protein CNMCM6936_009420 [Aspergillus lentulus]
MEFNLKSTVSDELTWIGALTNMVPGHIIFNIEPIVGARTVTTRSDRGNAAQASPSARRLSLPADRKGGALTVAPSASFPGLPLSGGAAAERASHGKGIQRTGSPAIESILSRPSVRGIPSVTEGPKRQVEEVGLDKITPTPSKKARANSLNGVVLDWPLTRSPDDWRHPSIARSAIKPDDVYLDPGARGCIQPLLNSHVWKVRCHLYIIYFITGYGSLLPTLETVLASGPQAQSTRPKTARS